MGKSSSIALVWRVCFVDESQLEQKYQAGNNGNDWFMNETTTTVVLCSVW